ncbi:MAG: hypothetical protein AAF799_39475 [Myxococcota bacterium]
MFKSVATIAFVLASASNGPSSCCHATIVFEGAESQTTGGEDTTSSSTSGVDDTSAATTEDIVPECGNEVVEAGEDCDGGPCCSDCVFEAAGVPCDEEFLDYRCWEGLSLQPDEIDVCNVQPLCAGDSADCDPESAATEVCRDHQTCELYESCEQGVADCQCIAETLWEPDARLDRIEEGWDYDDGARVPWALTPMELEVSEGFSAGSILVRACKGETPSSPFQEDVYLYFEGLDGTVLYDGMLPRTDTDCTERVELQPFEDFEQGENFGGWWTVVSPYEYQWHWTHECWRFPGWEFDPWGYCWRSFGIPTMERTCLPAE